MNDLKNPSHTAARAEHYLGASAESRFNLLLDRAFEEDATGGAHGYRWGPAAFQSGCAPTLIRIDDPATLNLAEFQMVVIDAGNSSGDSWKYIYHPAAQSGTFIKEA